MKIFFFHRQSFPVGYQVTIPGGFIIGSWVLLPVVLMSLFLVVVL